MISPKDALEIGRALHTTWGTKGVARRAVYEAQRRFGLTRRSERRWLQELARVDVRFRDVQLVTVPKRPPVAPQPIRLYGALEIAPQFPEAWHVHPFTGFRRPLTHWSELSEGEASTGDIKDLWELGRLTWLGPLLQRVAGGDDAAAEEAWGHIESFIEHNPPYRGPQWMCGQESALRGIVVMFTAYALGSHPASTPHRLAMAARLVATTVGRIRPTIGYALSQRNNHAISEAAFLWTAARLVDGLPDAQTIEWLAARALSETVDDQVYEDGAYAQHSPTYQRLALHALLWVEAAAKATATAVPFGITEALARSHRFLASLVDVSSGRMPNFAGNDGALLFDLAVCEISDFRPLLGHTAARTRQAAPGADARWTDEAIWFGTAPEPEVQPPQAGSGVSHHVLRGERSHAVLRAGPLRHRPAHADQLHVDVWIDGVNVASDPGSYRYTALGRWQNALADEAVHNLPRVPGRPQAVRRGRFLWSRWATAIVSRQESSDKGDLVAARLELDGVRFERTVARRRDSYLVHDVATDTGVVIRWNLPADAEIETGDGLTTVRSRTWHAQLLHSGTATVRQRDVDDPSSGWMSPTYGVCVPVTAVEVRVTEAGVAVSEFAPSGAALAEAPGADALAPRAWLA